MGTHINCLGMSVRFKETPGPMDRLVQWPSSNRSNCRLVYTSGVLLGRIDGLVWYRLPIGCTLEDLLSSNQPTVGHLWYTHVYTPMSRPKQSTGPTW